MARGSPLPLAGDGSARFLPWLIGLMVFLAALSTVAAFAIGTTLDRWDSGLRGTLTVQLPAPAGGGVAPDTLAAALQAIRGTRGVAVATALDGAATARLLKPWLGDAIEPGLLPLPVLIDVHAAEGAEIDRAVLGARLAQIVPGASVEQHGAWLDQMFRIARLIGLGTAAVVVLVGAVAAVAVIFTTRTGLALHAGIIDLLHLIGATDAYVARQFERHAFRLGLRGGVIGLLMAFLAFGAMRIAAEQGLLASAGDLMPGFHVPLLAWAAVLLLPLLVGCIGLLTARFTVLRTLARMP